MISSLTSGGITWYNAANVTEVELRQLQRKYDFHDLDIDDCLSENERPKIEEYSHYLFFVFHLPAKAAERINKEEVNIFLGKDFIVTLHEGKTGIIDAYWKSMAASQPLLAQALEKGTGFFLYRLMHDLFDRGFPLIESLVKELRRIEVSLFEQGDERVDVLKSILTLKRNIITMRSILMPQRAVVAVLQHKNKDLIPSELDIYFDDVQDAIERQWSLLDTAKELSEVLQDTHESWMGNRTTAIIRMLTIFSVTMLPITFLTGLYGMNIALPLQNHPQIFGVLVGVMISVVVVLLGYFRWKRWL